MAYSRAIVKRAEARLQNEKEQNERFSRARIAAIYEKEPRLAEIERELRKTAAHVLAVTFRTQGDPVSAMQQLKKENLALQQERDWLLQAEGVDADDLSVTPICPHCGGSGYVGAAMCECLRELCRQEQKKELTSLLGSGKETFDTFRLDVYPDAYDAALGASPRQLMKSNLRICRRYAEGFGADSGNLLFSGATGLGKTFLSACIARQVADSGFSVVYETAGKLFADFEAEKFGASQEENRGRTRKYLECDLLIIDDLGTEMTTQFTISALYTVINTRMMESRATVISTNLADTEIEGRYSPQIASRILGTFRLVQFAGDDIRRR